ncbi:MAG TPA: hypothetical protein PJ988_13340, partial [Anaerolinea sp.]|nr:hypothetical protein [Anaerolinea sp.]
ETGFSLLALSLNAHLGTEIFAMLFLPRVVALGLWSLSVSVFLNDGHSLQYHSLQRIAEKFPFASAGLAASLLTLAGLPLLAAFPIRQVLLQEIAVVSPLTALWVLGGSMGLLFSAFRLLSVITGGYFGPRPRGETRSQIFLISSGVIALLLVGLQPRLFLPLLTNLLSAFTRMP